ncbi:MAG TPA: PfkB family carbohydrate kinase, partial [Acidobacteriota bacterium]|nr:PfkB family carbohydrate kinase [Acidobacteriota bacterium]
ENALTLGQQIELRILDSLRSLLPDSDALVISDYSLGNLTSAVRGEAIRFARELEIPVIVDSRDNPHKYPGATTITPNITEVEKTLDVRIGRDLKKLEIVGREVLQTWDLRNLLVTRGKLGLSLIGPDQTLHLEAHGSEDAVDVTGAGDTVAAAYATALASGAPYEDAARLANVAGGLVVMKKGTSTVSPEELRETMTSGK